MWGLPAEEVSRRRRTMVRSQFEVALWRVDRSKWELVVYDLWLVS